MHLVVQHQGFHFWLKGTLACPDLGMDPGCHYIWGVNDDSLCTFLLEHISHAECKIVRHLSMSDAIWEVLHICYEKCGTYTQITLLKQVIEIHFTAGTPVDKMINKINDIITHVSHMGDLSCQYLKHMLLSTLLMEISSTCSCKSMGWQTTLISWQNPLSLKFCMKGTLYSSVLCKAKDRLH